MRKCVLGVLGEIVMKVLTKEDMTETDKDDRDNFLDCLEDHVHDVHAHVRYNNLWFEAVLWIRIRNGSVFRSFLDPDPYSENGSKSTQVNIGR